MHFGLLRTPPRLYSGQLSVSSSTVVYAVGLTALVDLCVLSIPPNSHLLHLVAVMVTNATAGVLYRVPPTSIPMTCEPAWRISMPVCLVLRTANIVPAYGRYVIGHVTEKKLRQSKLTFGVNPANERYK